MGRGESTWLGWFLYATLKSFAALAQNRGEPARGRRWLAHATELRSSLEREAWDGGWYVRGYFDDGTPLGSAASEECRIDSIAQSWAVISGAADMVRATQAMTAVDEQLIERDTGLALLFAPPFDRTPGRPRLCQRVSTRNPRERRPVHTRRNMVGDCFRTARRADKAAELYSLLNPINRTTTRADVHRYKVEPYVVAADIYSRSPHVGRGGWTWYTGSAGWMYRAGIEWILGFQRQGNVLRMAPCIPAHWPGFEINYRHGTARYEIAVENPDRVGQGVVHAELDGLPLAGPLHAYRWSMTATCIACGSCSASRT
jgi:cyclic beta-1,2-glucan synthetase